jgi:hypothetical protein
LAALGAVRSLVGVLLQIRVELPVLEHARAEPPLLPYLGGTRVDGAGGDGAEHVRAAADVDEGDLLLVDALLAQQGDHELMQERSDRSGAYCATFEVLDGLDGRVLGHDSLQRQQGAASQDLELCAFLDRGQHLPETGQRAHVHLPGQQAADQLRAVRHMQDIGIEPQLLEYSLLLQQRGQHHIGVAGGIDHVDLDRLGGR